MKLQGYKRIVKEDYDKKDQDIVSKLAYSINTAFDSVFQAINKNLTISDNLNMMFIDITGVRVDANGVPNAPLQLKYTLPTNCKGLQVINLTNNTSSNVTPTQTPFVSFTQASPSLLKISNITGLVADSSYSLTLIAYGT